MPRTLAVLRLSGAGEGDDGEGDGDAGGEAARQPRERGREEDLGAADGEGDELAEEAGGALQRAAPLGGLPALAPEHVGQSATARGREGR